MKLKPLKQQQLPDANVARFASNVRDWSEQFQEIPHLSGRLIEDIAVTTSTKKVNHGLKRIPKGYIIVAQDADARIWETARTDTTITFDSSATVTISIWIF